ncbi:MAG: cysteine peptidase family C39 domain-containing protein [Gemmatimonadales bacterium]|jgi:hypothetical protein
MGIYRQPGKTECGPFALKHALLMHGILASEWEIGRLAGTSHEGTDEAQLELAARHFGCELPTIRQHEPDAARQELTGYLRQGVPCLLCVDEWDHWVTAVHTEKQQYIVLDSERSEVIVVLDWPRLSRLWVYHEENEGAVQTLYDLHPLLPKRRVPTRARFSLERAHQLRQPEYRRLAELWDRYVEDLIGIGRPHERQGGRAVALGEFLRRHAALLREQLEEWHGQIDRVAAGQVLERMRFVADTYGLVIRQRDEKRVLSAVSMILALWAAGEFGIEPLFRRVPVRKIR